ncbi:hypothetical protein ACFY9C_35360 [Streptomyces filamentosus]|uniref:hypothetical protein n=1 Tax=Streptomyces filamentosus TaxID=67294 RepID=UPI0036E1891C
MESGLAALAVGVLTGAATGFGQETVATVARMVRERLSATPRGQAALAGVETAPGDETARREAEAVLHEALRADPVFQQVLAAHLSVSTTQTQMSNVVNVHGTRMRGSQISLGPVTVHKPNTTAGLLGLAAAIVVVAALLVYGLVQLTGGTESDDGKGGRARALSQSELQLVVPQAEDLPGNWKRDELDFQDGVDGTTCNMGTAAFMSPEKEVPGASGIATQYSVVACPDTATATTTFGQLTKVSAVPNAEETPLPVRLGDQSKAGTSSLEGTDPFGSINPLQEQSGPELKGSLITWRARVGTVVILMTYGPVRDGESSAGKAEDLMRVVVLRARDVQENG